MSETSATPTIEELPITALKGVGASLATRLLKLGIETVHDVLFHLPHRYLDRTRITPISQLRLNSSYVVQGYLLGSQIKFGKRRSLECTLEDNSGTVKLRFFHFSSAQKDRLSPGTLLRIFGEARMGASGIEFYHPEYEFVDLQSSTQVEECLTPVYGLTEGITQPRLRKIILQAVEFLNKHSLDELLPPEINQKFGVESLAAALSYIHLPPKNANVEQLLAGLHPSQQRLAFEELLAHFLVRQQLRLETQQHFSPALQHYQESHEKFLMTLPFAPTKAQERVFQEIKNDMSRNKPMLRMVQGDVGSGKTLVAAFAALQAANNGFQVAIAAPTEILAEQHFNNFASWLEPMGINIGWLVGKLTAKKKREAYEAIRSGQYQVVVGTHALFQDEVMFAQLGLVIIDEQHRFGVDQRLSLQQKSLSNDMPHQLVMTATPIPRTLAMTAYSELDYSVIDELPPGRTPVNTLLVSQKRRPEVIRRIRVACAEGRQVYWVCPLIEESETLSAANAEETSAILAESLPDVPHSLCHGRLKAKEKEQVMADFKAGKTQLLVATTVIEVGVDVPNASLMVIENPERLGLAQLHQLRGRVGRGSIESHCVLLYGDKLSNDGRERLKVLRESTDGFVISEKDLELRGPGELLGTRQTGDMAYQIADAQRDASLLPFVHQVGEDLLTRNLRQTLKITQRWFGHNKSYARV